MEMEIRMDGFSPPLRGEVKGVATYNDGTKEYLCGFPGFEEAAVYNGQRRGLTPTEFYFPTQNPLQNYSHCRIIEGFPRKVASVEGEIGRKVGEKYVFTKYSNPDSELWPNHLLIKGSEKETMMDGRRIMPLRE